MTFLFERFLGLIGICIGISLITFGLTNLAPGDPAEILLEIENPGVTPTRETIEAYREQLGLNDPLPQRYLRWLGDLLQGDLGLSYRSGQPVTAEIAARLPGTLTLTATSLGMALVIGVPLGILAALRRGSVWDLLSRLLALLGATLPNYVISFLLILLFAVGLGWLPAFGSGTPQHLILPSIALAAGIITQVMRLTRASVLDAVSREYVRTARAKGLHEARVIWGHVLRNALLPVITVIGVSVGNLLSGTVIVETIFSWFGIGKYAVDAIFLRDYPVIQGVVLYMALAFVLVNFGVDLLYRWLDPRLAEKARG
jgi:peptide/nickel transport system permease protein